MQQAAQAYAQTAQATVHPRELEAALLTKAANRLQTLIDTGALDAEVWREALYYNRQLWVVFATSVTRPENPLPDAIKQNIANLSVFIFRQSMEAQAEQSHQALRSIITINREVAAGLRGDG